MILSKFIDELPIPPILKPRWKNQFYTYYEVNMTEFRQSLHSQLNDTTVWGYEDGYPGPTIEVESGEKVFIKWINNLPGKHLFPIDYTVHGAHRDVPDVRTVVHVHGACVEWESDGYPEAWFTKGFKQVGPYFRKQIYRYDNCNHACTLWYHDHTIGITRLNIYAGLAGFYLIRENRERSLNLPSGKYEIPLMIQDKTFNKDGSLYYPKQPEKPIPELEMSITPKFIGDTILVNGKVWPYLKVEPRKYRFRLLNASNTRFYRIKLDSGQLMYQIATDGGLLEYPVGLKEIMLAPAERADVIIDFTNLEGKNIIMTNDAPAPFPGGDKPDPNTVCQVMQFRVTLPLSSVDTSTIPAHMMPVPKTKEQSVTRVRCLTLNDNMDQYGREWMLLDNNPWDAPISENPKLGATEIWYLINVTDDSHPIHLHLIDFQILDRRNFDVEKFNKEKVIEYTGPAMPLEPQERGWKDTVRANPKQVTRIIMQFGPFTGLYVWHCHILEHEDYEMMGPYIVIR
ncbi:multicopper oxidase domain-containing protein [Terrilactibacillus sp. BCM23-1]|uniref:Multicopper oxidase domain-containing protein n=1 Tax=Terrilactibacillus tamarindi TaxID=2599694 RepID=A0A6N8CS90_9BACI|nr:multicopper oxidase [Terrilactibacillus tamarindi]MTT32067.1 multicopper oxidase domain-containing protein [Terrilactibacillus tamarindi]